MASSRFCHFFNLTLLILLLVSCNKNTFADEEALLEYLKDEENGYVQRKSVNGIDFELMYRPTDLLVKQELGDSITSDKVKILREKYSKYLYFNLSMSKNNQEILNSFSNDQNQFGAMVNQLAFGMNEKVHLYTQQRDTIEMIDFVYPRMYGMSKSTTIMFVYPRKETENNKSNLIFTIEGLGLNTGEVKFKIQNKRLNNEPSIDI